MVNGSADSAVQMWRRGLADEVANAYRRLTHPQEDGFPLLQDPAGGRQPSRRARKSVFARAAKGDKPSLVLPRGAIATRVPVDNFFEKRPSAERDALTTYCTSAGMTANTLYEVKSGALPCGGSVHAANDFRGRAWWSSVTYNPVDRPADEAYGMVTALVHVYTARGEAEEVAIVRVMQPRSAPCEATGMRLFRWAGVRPAPADFIRPPVTLRPTLSLSLSIALASIPPRRHRCAKGC